MFNAERVEARGGGKGGGAVMKKRVEKEQRGLRWDKEGVPLQNPSLKGRKGGEAEGYSTQ